MTPDQALSKAMDVIDQHVPLAHYKVPQLAASIALAFRAALRERDAAHEIALKKALDGCECDACYGISPVECDAEKMADRLRALLEEAGK